MFCAITYAEVVVAVKKFSKGDLKAGSSQFPCIESYFLTATARRAVVDNRRGRGVKVTK